MWPEYLTAMLSNLHFPTSFPPYCSFKLYARFRLTGHYIQSLVHLNLSCCVQSECIQGILPVKTPLEAFLVFCLEYQFFLHLCLWKVLEHKYTHIKACILPCSQEGLHGCQKCMHACISIYVRQGGHWGYTLQKIYLLWDCFWGHFRVEGER